TRRSSDLLKTIAGEQTQKVVRPDARQQGPASRKNKGPAWQVLAGVDVRGRTGFGLCRLRGDVESERREQRECGGEKRGHGLNRRITSKESNAPRRPSQRIMVIMIAAAVPSSPRLTGSANSPRKPGDSSVAKPKASTLVQ